MQTKLDNLSVKNNNIDINEYIEFVQKVKSTMQNPEWLGDFSKEDIKSLLENGSVIWMYYLNHNPVCSMMIIPSTEKELLKLNLTEYKDIVDYGPMMVDAKYIGYGLQNQMLKVLEEYLRQKNFKYALTTVHPDNIYSINNLIKNNFQEISHMEFKRGPRNIYLKNIFNQKQ